jgi:hypothetical protein
VTLSGNSTRGSGGGVYHWWNEGGVLKLANCTITANVADADNDGVAKGDLDGLTVTRTKGDHPHATQMNGQWWAISPALGGGAAYAVNLSLPHTVIPHTDAWACRYEAAGGQGR